MYLLLTLLLALLFIAKPLQWISSSRGKGCVDDASGFVGNLLPLALLSVQLLSQLQRLSIHYILLLTAQLRRDLVTPALPLLICLYTQKHTSHT